MTSTQTTTTPVNYDRQLIINRTTGTGKLTFRCWIGSSKEITSTAAYNDGAWHYAATRLGSSGMFLYVDGAQVATDANTTAENQTEWWRFGHTPNGYFNGTLDEVRVAHSELSADFIKLSYQTRSRMPPP